MKYNFYKDANRRCVNIYSTFGKYHEKMNLYSILLHYITGEYLLVRYNTGDYVYRGQKTRQEIIEDEFISSLYTEEKFISIEKLKSIEDCIKKIENENFKQSEIDRIKGMMFDFVVENMKQKIEIVESMY